MSWSKKVTTQELNRFKEIESLIGRIEGQTDAEIVPVVVSESHDYAFYEFRLAIILGLLTFFCTLMWIKPIEALIRVRFWDYDSAHLVIVCGGLAFMVMLLSYLLVNIPVLDRLIIPSRVMSERAHERALRCFAQSHVSYTDNRLGLLIFVSLLERRVELVADKGLKQAIKQEVWQEIIAEMGPVLKNKGLIDGLANGIEKAGLILTEHFPRTSPKGNNHLADQLTVLER